MLHIIFVSAFFWKTNIFTLPCILFCFVALPGLMNLFKYIFFKSLSGLPSGDLFVSKSRSHPIPPLWKIGKENAILYASMVN